MVRHKKDNFSRGGKKFNPRSKPVPRGNEDTEGAVSSRPPYKAACWDMGHCDPKRCSGKRLMKLGLMRDLHIGQRHPGVIISYVSHRISFLAHILTIRNQSKCKANRFSCRQGAYGTIRCCSGRMLLGARAGSALVADWRKVRKTSYVI
jgi:hypothetical protein